MKKMIAGLLMVLLLITACTPQTEPGTDLGLKSNVLVCYPAAGTDLHVISTISFMQAGQGAASLTNQRAITGVDSMRMVRSEDGASTAVMFPKTVGAGAYDWLTGELTVTHLLLNLTVESMTGAENFPGWDILDDTLQNLVGPGQNNRLVNLNIEYYTNIGAKMAVNTCGSVDRLFIGSSGMTRSEWQAQYPNLVIQLCIQLPEPMVFELEAEPMAAIDGTNTLQASSGILSMAGQAAAQQPKDDQPQTETTEPTENTGAVEAGAQESSLKGKTINALGDSITSTNYERPVWWEQIAEETGAAFQDYSVSGTSLAYLEELETSKGKCFVNRYEEMDAKADGVVVMGGTNDNAVPLGDWDSTDVSTFYGALNVLIPGLQKLYPDKPILFCTMIQTKSSYKENVGDPLYTLMAMSPTDTLTRQLRAAAIQAKCAQYGIACLDLYTNSGISGEGDGAQYYRDDDGLHPSALGQQVLKQQIGDALEKLFAGEPLPQ